MRSLTRFLVGFFLAGILLLAGCDTPFEPGSATVSLEDTAETEARSIVPEQADDPVEYRVSGNGPSGASFTQTVATLPLEVADLAAGEWAILVEALDAAGTVVLEGSTTVLVSTEGATPVSVTLVPPEGMGGLSLALDWPAARVADPRVVATLYRDGFDPVELSATVTAGSALVTGSEVAAGWYRIQLRLYDGDALVAGRAELLQVRGDTVTQGTVALDQLNKPGAVVTVTGTSFTLAWAAPPDADPDDPLASYNVYFRERGTYPWTYLGGTAGPVESFEVKTSMLDYGVYEFGVTSVTTSGVESDPHTSLCDTADPQSGWFVDWRS
ncbi:MAG: fibronectin type III domain-containing protein [Spirochaetota bacterium]